MNGIIKYGKIKEYENFRFKIVYEKLIMLEFSKFKEGSIVYEV